MITYRVLGYYGTIPVHDRSFRKYAEAYNNYVVTTYHNDVTHAKLVEVTQTAKVLEDSREV